MRRRARVVVLATAGAVLMTTAVAAQEAGTDGEADAQAPEPTVEVREVAVRKNRPDEVFHNAGTAVTFWVKDEAGEFTWIRGNDTQITRFADSAGTDLIAAHERQIRAWDEKVDRLREESRWVSMGRTRELYRSERLDANEGVSGFYLVVESWEVPSEQADSITVAAEVAYLVSTDESAREVFDEIDIQDTKIVRVGEYGIRPIDFNRSDGTLSFTLYSDLQLTRFDVRDADGELVGEIAYRFNNRPVVRMPEALFEEPVHLTVEYRVPIRRSVEIERAIDVGL